MGLSSSAEVCARDRAIGALLGLAVGDAVGTTLEFEERDSKPPLTDMVGGGPFELEPGEWTDDTSMALCLADSLIAGNSRFDPADLMRRFVRWRDRGENSVNRRPMFDIGSATAAALRRWERTEDPYAGSIDPHSAGNGSLMRLSPVAIRFWNDPGKAMEAAVLQSRTTHGAPEAVDACRFFAEVLVDAIGGQPLSAALRSRLGGYVPAVADIASGAWRGKPRGQVQSTGYVIHSLEAALWCVDGTPDFESAILKAANLGGDSDTTAAIAGQLAGAVYGTGGIPPHWLDRLAERGRIEGLAIKLFEQSKVTS